MQGKDKTSTDQQYLRHSAPPTLLTDKNKSVTTIERQNTPLCKSGEYAHPEIDISGNSLVEILLEDRHNEETNEKNEDNVNTKDMQQSSYTGPRIVSLNHCEQISDSSLLQLAQSAPKLQQLYCKK